MYEIWKVPVDAYDDPPACGTKQTTIGEFSLACQVADTLMQEERDPESAYFVIDSTGREGTYSVGYIEPIGVTA